MLLKDFQNSGGQIPTDDIDSNAGTTRTVNGVVNPTLTIRPGETQFWRIANIGADIYYRLQLDGHVLYEIARDGNRQTRVVAREEILLPPAARTEVLVQGGPRGVYALRTLYFDQGADGDQYPEVILATLISAGRPEAPVPLPTPRNSRRWRIYGPSRSPLAGPWYSRRIPTPTNSSSTGSNSMRTASTPRSSWARWKSGRSRMWPMRSTCFTSISSISR